MAPKKKDDQEQPTSAEEVYNFPAFGISVTASTLDEALEKLEDQKKTLD